MPSRVEKRIDNMDSKVGVSKAGTDWMKSALDPFPDEPRDCEGYPDTVNGPSIVQKLKFQVTIAKPAGVVGNWDCLIFSDAFDSEYNCIDSLGYPYLAGTGAFMADFDKQGGSGIACGGVMVRAGTSGQPLNHENTVKNVPVPDSYWAQGRTRVIAKGFEVHNTTNALTKQGAVAVYRAPTVASEVRTGTALDSANALVFPAPFDYQEAAHTPNEISNVLNVLDSKEWKAEDGCLCVCTLATPVINPHEGNSVVFPLIRSKTAAGADYTYFADLVPIGTTPLFTLPSFTEAAYSSPFNQSGAFFTGLSPETTLTLVVHYILERFPDETNLDLVVLTTRSPAYDPSALELYARAAAYLPTGVPVKDNASGDWIKNIADMLATCGVPGMPLIKGAVDLYNQMPSLDPSVKVRTPKGKAIVVTERYAKRERPARTKAQLPPRSIGGFPVGRGQAQQKRVGKNNPRSPKFLGPIRPGMKRGAMNNNS